MDPTNPEILHVPDLLRRIVDYRANLLAQEASWVTTALRHMDSVNEVRESKNKRLFMSSVARNTDVIGAFAGVDSMHDPAVASKIPEYLIQTDEKVTAEHIAAVNESIQQYQTKQEKPTEEDLQLARLRDRVQLLSTPLNNADLTAENEQFTWA